MTGDTLFQQKCPDKDEGCSYKFLCMKIQWWLSIDPALPEVLNF